MNKLGHIAIALAVLVITGTIFLIIAYLIIYNLAPPEDPANTGNLGLGQVLLALAFTLLYIILMARFIYQRKRRKLMQAKEQQ